MLFIWLEVPHNLSVLSKLTPYTVSSKLESTSIFSSIVMPQKFLGKCSQNFLLLKNCLVSEIELVFTLC